MNPARRRPPVREILLVEDDPGDQELTRRALTREGIHANLRVVADAPEALDYLFHRGNYLDPTSSPRPDLILLDLNLPRISGSQVLRATKRDDVLSRTPVVVFTTSARERDIEESYAQGCSAYVIKPGEAHQFMYVVRDLCRFWFEVAELPAH